MLSARMQPVIEVHSPTAIDLYLTESSSGILEQNTNSFDCVSLLFDPHTAASQTNMALNAYRHLLRATRVAFSGRLPILSRRNHLLTARR